MHDGDADGGAGQLVAQRLGESAHRELACRIRHLFGRRHDAEDARDVHEARVVAGAEQREKGAGHAHHAPEIDAEEPFEVVFGDLLEGAPQRDAGVVHEHVHLRVRGAHGIRERRHRRTIGHVELMRGNAECRGQQPHRLRETARVDVGERQVTATPGERHGNAAADTASRPGDHGRTSGQAHGAHRPLRASPGCDGAPRNSKAGSSNGPCLSITRSLR